MKIEIKRLHFLPKATIGKLYIDGQDMGIFTLEDRFRERKDAPVSEWKIPGDTAIPAGTYKMVLDYSERFQRIMPHIMDVPGFEGVRIHCGNTDADTEGCILVGNMWSGGNFIADSRAAFAEILPLFMKAKEMEITVG